LQKGQNGSPGFDAYQQFLPGKILKATTKTKYKVFGQCLLDKNKKLSAISNLKCLKLF